MSKVVSQSILYDRVIDVDLLWTEELAVDALILTTDNKKTTKGTEVGMTRLARIKSFQHMSYTQDRVGNLVSRVITAQGSVYRYDLGDAVHKDNFDKGLRPNGDPLKSGDKLLVNNNGTIEQYHMTEVKQPEDGEILPGNPYLIKHKISIHCPATGLKPSISFTVNLIPGMNCYDLTLKLTNINLDIDIRKITRIRMRAGYRTQGFMDEYDCPVFSSYMESANPDGVMVFKCLAVGTTSVFSSQSPIKIHYLGGTCTIKDVITEVCSCLGIKKHNLLLPVYNNLNISMQKMNTVAENANALLEWLRKIIIQRIKFHEPALDPPEVIVQLTKDGLYVYITNRANASRDDEGNDVQDSSIISLDAVKGASFNGVALTVKAVWNPRLRPGDTFEMFPTIINGVNLPNTITREGYGASGKLAGRYRVITMSISFSTTGGENEMSVLAVPLIYIGTAEEASQTSITMEEFASELSQEWLSSTSLSMSLGSADDVTEKTEAQKAVALQKDNTRDMFSVKTLGKVGGVYKTHVVEANECLSRIASAWYDPDGAPDGNTYFSGTIDVDRSKMTDPSKYRGRISHWHLWPIIAVHTYQFYTRLRDSNSSNNPFENFQQLDNPNMVRIGRQVVIPKIDSFESLKEVRDIFKYASESYRNIEGYKYFVEAWETMYYYLGGN